MLVKIIESGEIKEVSYIVNGIDNARDIMGNYDALQYDNEPEDYVISQDDFEWWSELFQKLEKLDEAIELLNDNDINTDDIYNVDNCDLGDSVEEQLNIAMDLLRDNDIEM